VHTMGGMWRTAVAGTNPTSMSTRCWGSMSFAERESLCATLASVSTISRDPFVAVVMDYPEFAVLRLCPLADF
jgi:hypothetical protein